MSGGMEWTDEDDFALSREGITSKSPLWFAWFFIDEVMQGNPDVWMTVTPESRAEWGDFSEARAVLAAVPGLSWMHVVVPAQDAPDVVYMPILADDPDIPRPTVRRLGINDHVNAVGWLTIVWRPEIGDDGFWLIHAAGARIQPEDCPRTSPGVAPTHRWTR